MYQFTCLFVHPSIHFLSVCVFVCPVCMFVCPSVLSCLSEIIASYAPNWFCPFVCPSICFCPSIHSPVCLSVFCLEGSHTCP